ncbi:hypothetical protein F8M41_006327 [Gigaspora margarita]|uniref:Uncharacterized protein n=1 Tax=Gigaspora margarita TaxID=4874 RepID=A0A8H4AWV5_GIGMA|nr:hypothetical protein F8M41_006327 [Gigaspora margarita]
MNGAQPQINNNGQPRHQNNNFVQPPQNNANRVNNDQQYNDLINGADPFNRIQCPPQQDTEFAKSLFSGIGFP